LLSTRKRLGIVLAALFILALATQRASAQPAPGPATAPSDQSVKLQTDKSADSGHDLFVRLTVTTDWKLSCPEKPLQFGEVWLVGPDGKESLLISVTSDQVFNGTNCSGENTLSIGRKTGGQTPGTYRVRLNAHPVFIPLGGSGLYGRARVGFELYSAPEADPARQIVGWEFPMPQNLFPVGGLPQIEFVFNFK
jgi:hypothetical protein